MSGTPTPWHHLTPLKRAALARLCEGPLTRQPDGWRPGFVVSQDGTTLPFNSHTVGWLAERGACRISGNTATVTRLGREVDEMLSDQEWRREAAE